MNKPICPRCHAANPNDKPFCADCGASLAMRYYPTCPHCGAPNEAETKFCPECGTNLVVQDDDEMLGAPAAVTTAIPPQPQDTPAWMAALPEGLEPTTDGMEIEGGVLKQYHGNATVVVVPAGVTQIGQSAFQNNLALCCVVLPNTVTEIQPYAFDGCRGLTEIQLGNGVINIGEQAFCNCVALTSISLPAKLQRVEPGAFCYCPSLLRVDYAGTLRQWCNIRFDSYTGLLANADLYIQGELVEDVVIPEGVTYTKEGTFTGYKKLRSIVCPVGFTKIGRDALSGCTSLTKLIAPDCTDLASSEIGYCPIQEATLHTNAIFGFKNKGILNRLPLKTLVVTGTEIPDMALAGNNTLTALTIDDSVTTIGQGSFYQCSNLTKVAIGNGVEIIGAFAFRWCKKLAQVELGNRVTRVGSSAFADCPALRQVELPDSITKLDNEAFLRTGLTQIALGDKLTEIGSNCFSYCTALQKVTFGNHLEVISEYAFAGCTALDDVNLPDCLQTIGKGTFEGCTGLIRVIGNGVEYIGDSAFKDCQNLIWVELPRKKVACESGSFTGCQVMRAVVDANMINWRIFDPARLDSLTVTEGDIEVATDELTHLSTLVLQDGVTSLHSDAFRGMPSLAKVVLGNGLTELPKGAFRDCKLLTEICVSASVVRIESDVFHRCTSLAVIQVAEGNPVYHSTNNCLIQTDTKTLRLGCKNSIIPTDGSVTTLARHAFCSCEGLTALEIPAAVTSIPPLALLNCNNLTSLKVDPANPVYYSSGNCIIERNTKTVVVGCNASVLPNDGSITAIGEYAFASCSRLPPLPDSIVSINTGAFFMCCGLDITVPSSVQQIQGWAFNGVRNVFLQGKPSRHWHKMWGANTKVCNAKHKPIRTVQTDTCPNIWGYN